MKNVEFVSYDSSGRVQGRGRCREADAAKQGDGVDLFGAEVPAGVDSKRAWVDTTVSPHEVKEKGPSPHSINKTSMVADGTDVCTISNLHNPTVVTWPDGVVTEETDGFISFTIDESGTHSVTLDAVPYLKEVINVIATDPA